MIGVVGGGRERSRRVLADAREVGREVARRGFALVCGGLGGVMRAAAQGALDEGGATIGILPDGEAGRENPFISIVIPTGLGIGRNVIIARSARAIIAVGGEYGTLSEIAFGLQLGRPVVGLGSWDVPGVRHAENPIDAVAMAVRSLGAKD